VSSVDEQSMIIYLNENTVKLVYR